MKTGKYSGVEAESCKAPVQAACSALILHQQLHFEGFKLPVS